MEVNFNKINEELIQVYGEVNGVMKRNTEPENAGCRKYKYEVKFFDYEKKLVKSKGYCRDTEHLTEIVNRLYMF